MKSLVCLILASIIAGTSFAQKDSTVFDLDTVRVGNFVIIKKIRGGRRHRLAPGMIGIKQ